MRIVRALGWVALPALLLACNGHLESKSDAPAASTGSSYDEYQPSEDASAEDAYAADAPYDESGDYDDGYGSESARTQSMESQAQALEQQYQDARANARTPEEAEAAYQQFERDRAKLNDTGEGPPPR